MVSRVRAFGLLAALCLALPWPVVAQVTWQDLVFTGGTSAEWYRGNLASVTAVAVDSTDQVSAAVGEMGVRGTLSLFSNPVRSLSVSFDGGVRQFMPGGFEVRDYAPRELVGLLDARFRHSFQSVGSFSLESGVSGRGVSDRPPMPLYIQPGFRTANGLARFQFYPLKGFYFDADVFGARTDYGATALTPQLDLLDSRVLGAEVGVTWGPEWTLRFYTGYRDTEYGNQGTFDPSDPFRRDKAVMVGATWTLPSPSLIVAQVGVEGTLNRSNSSRPEYDALSVRGMVWAPLPYDFSVNLSAVLTTKDYLTHTDYARLVPGEEADNASVVYLELSRPLMVNLDGAVRFGWSRAETDIGDSYSERLGGTFLLRFRPWNH